MDSETTSAPVIPPPAPAPPRRVARVPASGTRVNAASLPGPAAGFSVGPTARSLPPGIPASLAGIVQTEGTAPAAPEVVRHSSFVPVPESLRNVRNQANALRNQLINSVTVGGNTVKFIDAALDQFASVSPEVLTAEGIDLERIKKYRDSIADALKHTEP